MPESPERFFFVHLQKTAGVSLRRRLEHHFGEAAVYPDASDGAGVEAVMSIEHLMRRYRARGDEIRVVTGHFPLVTAELLGGGFTTITVLREPVERTLSLLRHHRASIPEDRDESLEEIYSDPMRFQGLIHNHMVKMFSLAPDDGMKSALKKVEFTPERLERAKSGLASVNAFGLQERFDEFCEQLEREYGWDLGVPQRVNTSVPVEVSDEFRSRIAEDNAADAELYEFAVRMYEERRARDSEPRLRAR